MTDEEFNKVEELKQKNEQLQKTIVYLSKELAEAEERYESLDAFNGRLFRRLGEAEERLHRIKQHRKK